MTNDTLTQTQYLTVAEIAEDLRVAPMTVYRMINRGDFPAITLGHRTKRIPTSAYRDFKDRLERTARTAQARAAGTDRTPGPGQLPITSPEFTD